MDATDVCVKVDHHSILEEVQVDVVFLEKEDSKALYQWWSKEALLKWVLACALQKRLQVRMYIIGTY